MTVRLTKEAYPAFCPVCNGLGCAECHGSGDGPDAIEVVWSCSTCHGAGEGEVVECPNCGDDQVTSQAGDDDYDPEDAFDAPDPDDGAENWDWCLP